MGQDTWGQRSSKRVRNAKGWPETGPLPPQRFGPMPRLPSPPSVRYDMPLPDLSELPDMPTSPHEAGQMVSAPIRSLYRTGRAIGSGATDAALGFRAGLLGEDEPVDEAGSLPPRPTAPAMPRGAGPTTPAAPGWATLGTPAPDLAPAGGGYSDPQAAESLAQFKPREWSKRLQPGQMVMGGGGDDNISLKDGVWTGVGSGGGTAPARQAFPESKLMDPSVFRSLAPEEREAYVRSMTQMQTLQANEPGAMSLQERANAAQAAKDVEDNDLRTRGPGRLSNNLALQSLEWNAPVSRQKRQYADEQASRLAYQRYAIPEALRGMYDLEQQRLINAGLDARTAAEQAGETVRQRMQSQATVQSGALGALQRLKTGQMNSPLYAPGMPTPEMETYEPDFFNLAFPGGGGAPAGAAAPGAGVGTAPETPGLTQSPEMIGQQIMQMPEFQKLDPTERREYLRLLEQEGLSLTAMERQRLYGVLGIR
jgi:hypothetical protein